MSVVVVVTGATRPLYVADREDIIKIGLISLAIMHVEKSFSRISTRATILIMKIFQLYDFIISPEKSYIYILYILICFNCFRCYFMANNFKLTLVRNRIHKSIYICSYIYHELFAAFIWKLNWRAELKNY